MTADEIPTDIDATGLRHLGPLFVDDGSLTNRTAWKGDAPTAARRARPDGRTTGLGEG